MFVILKFDQNLNFSVPRFTSLDLSSVRVKFEYGSPLERNDKNNEQTQKKKKLLKHT